MYFATMESGNKDDKNLASALVSDNSSDNTLDPLGKGEGGLSSELKSLNANQESPKVHQEKHGEGSKQQVHESENEVELSRQQVQVGEEQDEVWKQQVLESENQGEVLKQKVHESENQVEVLKPQGHESENQSQGLKLQVHESRNLESEDSKETNQSTEEVLAEEKEADPVFDGTEAPELEATRSPLGQPLELDSEEQGRAWPEKAVALKNFVKEKGVVAVSTVLRRLSGRKDEDGLPDGDEKDDNFTKGNGEEEDSSSDPKLKEVSQKAGERSTWNPLNYIKIGRESDNRSKPEQVEHVQAESSVEERVVKGRIIVYTRLGCQDCKMVRLFMHQKGLKYVEINIDIFPSRKLELEKNTGSSAVPQVFFNDFLIGGMSELKAMDESGKLDEKINNLFTEEPSPAAPLPPLPGEDDESGSGKIDELASIARRMRESIIPRDRFYKMRRFSSCFLGSEAVDFLSEDQYLEREEAVEFARKLVKQNFFQHVMDENIFEDGNHLYRFLEHDPIVITQCYNIPRGTIDVKPKPLTEIASRLRFLSYAIFEVYVSEDGRHVDYGSLHGSEEFKRYLRIIEELHRVELDGLSREEKLAFFINLYNMMAIHAILTWGYPTRALERRKLLGDFKYVVGGCTYSLSAIYNGILRGNQRPPYNLIRPFGPRDKRFKVALPYPEPLVHFALICGARSGPALRCYSPGNIDKELMEAAQDFLRNGGLIIDAQAKIASVSKILQWYKGDFGKNEVEVLKHAANYLEPAKSEELLELLANSQLKVTYQPYDWGLNC
ncbi:Glutaredoxin [Cocos nucifera]|uniref:Glutaredoxin n=1 Tax=Cocos nucifera TaxID=13894 RepID=A0A8K0NB86_COCNU|nr:Glutaredoxin [Cocos nucifera]